MNCFLTKKSPNIASPSVCSPSKLWKLSDMIFIWFLYDFYMILYDFIWLLFFAICSKHFCYHFFLSFPSIFCYHFSADLRDFLKAHDGKRERNERSGRIGCLQLLSFKTFEFSFRRGAQEVQWFYCSEDIKEKNHNFHENHQMFMKISDFCMKNCWFTWKIHKNQWTSMNIGALGSNKSKISQTYP